MNNLSYDAILDILVNGEIELTGQFVWGSNYTYLTHVTHEDQVLPAVYKPSRGERPLWDFPPGTLSTREVAAYLISQALGWDLVPPTVFRREGPAGPGSLQLYIDADPDYHYFTFSEEEKQRLRPVVIFDILINNADRKGGHILLTSNDKIQVIDHGVCFHQEPKLRTVLWDFSGEPIPENLLGAVQSLRDRLSTSAELQSSLAELLSPTEIESLIRRADRLLAERHFPEPGPGLPYPYPLV